MKIAAIVPMRHSSERVPGKNYRLFSGRPLFHYVLNSLLKCPEVTEVVIDTDSETIKSDVSENFRSVRVIDRPAQLRAGDVPMNDVLLHTTSVVQADYYVQTHSTNPLLSSSTLSSAIQAFLGERGKFDSLFSVKRLQARLWSGDGRPINHDPSRLERTQDLIPLFEENSCIYIFSLQSLEKTKNRIGEKPMMFEMSSLESLDIDEEVDFRMAEYVYKGLNC